MRRTKLNFDKFHWANLSQLALVAILLMACFPARSMAQQQGQKTFSSAQDASNVLVTAAQNNDQKAMLGGDLFSILGPHGVTGMNLYDMLVAGIGSAILLTAYNAIGGDQPHRRWDDHAINGGSAQAAARGRQ